MAIAMQHLQLQMHFLTSLHVFVAQLLVAHSLALRVQVQAQVQLVLELLPELEQQVARQDLLVVDLVAVRV
jgi:hypothetical protein